MLLSTSSDKGVLFREYAHDMRGELAMFVVFADNEYRALLSNKKSENE